MKWNFNPNFAIPILLALLTLGGNATLKEVVDHTTSIHNPLLKKLAKEKLDNNILKYSNDQLLVYVKPPASPFRGTHDPRFCWRGSGYELKLIKEERQDGYLIYTGELIKGKDKLYTAWWYQDGSFITNSEWTWRTGSLLDSKSYSLINLNAETKANLSQAVKEYLKNSIEHE